MTEKASRRLVDEKEAKDWMVMRDHMFGVAYRTK